MPDAQQLLIHWGLPAIFVVVFIMGFAGMSVLLARAGGWYDLSKIYPRPPSERPLRRRWLASAKINRVYYNSGLIVAVGVSGVFLSCIPPFNVGAPPLYIPWSKLRFIARSKFLWRSCLSLQTETGTPIMLYGIAADLVDRAGPWPP